MDEIDQLISEIVPTTKPEGKSETELKDTERTKGNGADTDVKPTEGDDDNWEPDNAPVEERKTWDKKFVNALSRRDKDRNFLKSELAARDAKLAEMQKQLEARQATPPTEKKTETAQGDEGKPDIAKYQDFNKYLEDLNKWQAEKIYRELREKDAGEASKKADAEKAKAVSAEKQQKFEKQAIEFVKQSPENMQLLQENMDLIEKIPQPLMDHAEALDNPVIALAEIAKAPGGLQAFARLDAAQAQKVLILAEQIGLQKAAQSGGNADGAGDGEETQLSEQPTQAPKKPSNAPKPMQPLRSSKPGKKAINAMSADELFAELDIQV